MRVNLFLKASCQCNITAVCENNYFSVRYLISMPYKDGADKVFKLFLKILQNSHENISDGEIFK